LWNGITVSYACPVKYLPSEMFTPLNISKIWSVADLTGELTRALFSLLAMPFYGELKWLQGLFFRVEIRSA